MRNRARLFSLGTAAASVALPVWVIAAAKMAGAVSVMLTFVSANPADVVTRKVAGPSASSGNAALI